MSTVQLSYQNWITYRFSNWIHLLIHKVSLLIVVVNTGRRIQVPAHRHSSWMARHVLMRACPLVPLGEASVAADGAGLDGGRCPTRSTLGGPEAGLGDQNIASCTGARPELRSAMNVFSRVESRPLTSRPHTYASTTATSRSHWDFGAGSVAVGGLQSLMSGAYNRPDLCVPTWGTP